LISADVERLKTINDRHGHHAGDAVLISAAHVLTRSVRSSDLVARVGGDEFAVLIRGATLAVAQGIVRRIRRAERREKVVGYPVEVNLSLGVAVVAATGVAAPAPARVRPRHRRCTGSYATAEAENAPGCRTVVARYVAPLDRAAALEEPHHPDDEDRAHDGDDDRLKVDDVAIVTARANANRVGQEATDERTDDAQDDVAYDAQALVAADEQTGNPAGNRAQDYPGNDRY
jgi:hypothetical protein